MRGAEALSPRSGERGYGEEPGKCRPEMLHGVARHPVAFLLDLLLRRPAALYNKHPSKINSAICP